MNKGQTKEFIHSQVLLSKSMEGIHENLEKLNDFNVLHTTKSMEHRTNTMNKLDKVIETLKTMTDKYWWLIIALIAALLTVTGYGHVTRIFTGG